MIVHVINSLSGGGAEKQLAELVARSALDHEIVDLESLGTNRIRALRRRLARLAPDAVMAWLERSQLVVAAAAGARLPLIANVCGLPRRHGANAAALIAAFARYDAFVTNADVVRRLTRSFARPVGLDWFEVVPNGVETAPERAARRQIEGPLRIGYIGRADPAKGVDILADALRRLTPADVVATCVGRGVREALGSPMPATVASVSDGVLDPWAQLTAIDVLVVPSRSEGSPNVVIEAFARGIPVVATAAGGTVELLADGRGTLVPVGDPAALAGAIRRLRGQWHEAVGGAARARTYAREAHAWERVVTGYDSLIERVIRG